MTAVNHGSGGARVGELRIPAKHKMIRFGNECAIIF